MINPPDYQQKGAPGPLGDTLLSHQRVTSMRSMIQHAIEEEIARVIDEERGLFQKRVENLIRENVGGIAARVLEKFEMRMHGQKLVIEVDFQHPQT